MPETPDKYYGSGHRGLTIISMPSAGLIAVSDYPMTHEDLLSTEITDEEMRELYGNYYGDDIDMWDRSDFQNLADGYLSRAKVSGGRASVYFWQAKYASMFSAPKVRDLAGQIAAKLKELGHGFEVMEMSVPTTDFDGDVASFPQKKHYFRVRPGGVLESIKKDEYMSGGAPATMKPGAWVSPRGPEDWRGSPYWLRYEAGVAQLSPACIYRIVAVF